MITVITRTSNRPKYFKRCRESVIAQGTSIQHHVISDTKKDLEYLNDTRIIIHNVDKHKLLNSYKDPAPVTAKPKLLSIHNLYFNEVYSKIKEDWVYHLDDDNFLYPNQLVAALQNKQVNCNTDLIICKIKHFTGILPRTNDWNAKRVRLAGIDTGCFIAKADLLRKVKWDGWKCGDFRLIEKLVKLSKNTVWVDNIVMGMEKQNLGNRIDMI